MNCFGQRRSTGYSDAFVAFLCASTRCAAENPTQQEATAEQKETKNLLRVFVPFKIESFGWRLESKSMNIFGMVIKMRVVKQQTS